MQATAATAATAEIAAMAATAGSPVSSDHSGRWLGKGSIALLSNATKMIRVYIKMVKMVYKPLTVDSLFAHYYSLFTHG